LRVFAPKENTLSQLEVRPQVILTEETGWIGGQLTAQAVPPDEHP